MTWKVLLVRAVVGGLVLAVALLTGSAAVEWTLARRDAARFPAPGRLVELDGGRRLHLQCMGSGRPTLFLEMGAGAWGLFWSEIQARMSSVVRTCAYDRAGLGWSDAGPFPRGPDALVGDLRAVIEASGEEGPFVLVGHSLGGWLVRLYQARYPEDVVGMALVESAHPRQWRELPPEIWEFTRSTAGTLRIMSRLGRFGLLRLLRDQLATQDLPADVMEAYRSTAIRPTAMATLASEASSSEALAAQVEVLPDLGDLPLAVVSAGRSFDAFRNMVPDWPFEEANEKWLDLQEDLVSLSSRSLHFVSPESTHNIHSDDPALVVRALTELIDTVRVDLARTSVRDR